nr:rho GTPase activating protein [Hymenolepis microstoma]
MESLFLLGDLQPLKLTSTLLNRLSYLMTVLENAGAHFVEGIFRKTGNLTQQRAVADALLLSDFNCTTFPWHEYSAHELAGALKSIISHLEQPLLTSGLIPFYLQAANGQFAAVWSTYSENLMEAVKEPEDILTFRKKQPEKFKSICVSQLSFVLETPFDILSDIENQNNIKGTPMKQLLSRTRRKLGLWDQNSLEVKDDESPDMAVMKRYTYSKQVNALRILILLLPQMHKSLLQRLFSLLHRVTSQVARNRMSPLALGTVFGPVLVPSVFSETSTVVDGFQSQNSDIQDAITLATRMIELNKELFLLPTRLINDIRDNDSPETPTKHSKAHEKRSESAWCSPYRRSHASRRSSSPINTCIRYAHIGYSTPQMFHDVSNTIAASASPVSTDKINTSDKLIEAKLAGYV